MSNKKSNADRKFMENLLKVNEQVAANLNMSESSTQYVMDKIGMTMYNDNLRRDNEKTQEFWRNCNAENKT